MKIKKILAAVAAAAVAISAMAVNTFALTAENYLKDGTVYINADKAEDPTWAIDAGVDQTTVYGVTYHVTFSESEVADEAAWIGGGIGANSPSTGWKQIEWGRTDKTVIADLENGTITWLNTAPVFKANDQYAQFWLQTWGGTVTINSADILGEGGVILSTDEPAPAPAETEAAPEETEAAPAETEAEAPVEDEVDVAVDDDEDEAAPEETEAAPVETEAAAPAVTEAPAPAVTTTPAATGNTAVASIAAVMAIAGAAAIVAKKRK